MCVDKKNCTCGCSLTESFNRRRKKQPSLGAAAKKELIRESKKAMESLYNLYEICSKNKIDEEALFEKIDKGFKDINEMINFLVVK